MDLFQTLTKENNFPLFQLSNQFSTIIFQTSGLSRDFPFLISAFWSSKTGFPAAQHPDAHTCISLKPSQNCGPRSLEMTVLKYFTKYSVSLDLFSSGLFLFLPFLLLSQKPLNRMSKQTILKWEKNVWLCDVKVSFRWDWTIPQCPRMHLSSPREKFYLKMK